MEKSVRIPNREVWETPGQPSLPEGKMDKWNSPCSGTRGDLTKQSGDSRWASSDQCSESWVPSKGWDPDSMSQTLRPKGFTSSPSLAAAPLQQKNAEKKLEKNKGKKKKENMQCYECSYRDIYKPAQKRRLLLKPVVSCSAAKNWNQKVLIIFFPLRNPHPRRLSVFQGNQKFLLPIRELRAKNQKGTRKCPCDGQPALQSTNQVLVVAQSSPKEKLPTQKVITAQKTWGQLQVVCRSTDQPLQLFQVCPCMEKHQQLLPILPACAAVCSTLSSHKGQRTRGFKPLQQQLDKSYPVLDKSMKDLLS